MKNMLAMIVMLSGLTLASQAQDLPISQIMIEGESWELIAEGYQFTEGPAVNTEGEIYFTDVPASKIYKVSLDGEVSLFSDQANKTAGLMFGADGMLYGLSLIHI